MLLIVLIGLPTMGAQALDLGRPGAGHWAPRRRVLGAQAPDHPRASPFQDFGRLSAGPWAPECWTLGAQAPETLLFCEFNLSNPFHAS